MNNFWLIKSEPDTYSWADLENEQIGTWDGVRNYQARNNLKNMQLGDKCLFYHSVTQKSIVGVCEVCEEAFMDKSNGNENPNWFAVRVKPLFALKNPVSLAKINENPDLKDISLLRQTRLSVCPLTKTEFDELLKMGEVSDYEL